METHTINADGKKLGRVASEAANILRGKHLTSFRRDRVAPVSVRIENASKLSIAPKKMRQKEYKRYSGYPGGLSFESLERLIARRGHEAALRHAIRGMLPPNRLRPT